MATKEALTGSLSSVDSVEEQSLCSVSGGCWRSKQSLLDWSLGSL